MLNQSKKPNEIIIVDGGSTDGTIEIIKKYSRKNKKVKLIIDPNSGVGAQLLESRETGIVEGTVGGDLILNYISRDSKVKKGNAIVTSGLGGVFPKGIYIGTVEEIDQKSFSLYKEIKITSPIDFSRIEEVMVIINPPPEYPFDIGKVGD